MFCTFILINGDGEYGTVAASIGGSEAQAYQLGPKVGCHRMLCYIYQMNRVNCRNGSDMVTAS